MKVNYTPVGTVCTKDIEFEIEGNVVKNLKFTRGCQGNLKAIGKLVEGMEVDRVIELLEGNTCGPRDTSCTDQLAKALREYKDK